MNHITPAWLLRSVCVLSLVIAASPSAAAPTRDLLFGSFGNEAQGACAKTPCASPEHTCTEYPDEGPNCRECINDPSIPDYPDDTACSDITDFKQEHNLNCKQATLFVKNPPECCIYGGPFADEAVHQAFLGGPPEETGLPYGIKAYATDRYGRDQTYCYVHKKVLAEMGAAAGFNPNMVPTLFLFDPATITWKGTHFNNFCDHPDNTVQPILPDVSAALEASGAKWAYDCDPDGPFASIQADVAAATAWVGMSQESGCKMAYEGEEPCTYEAGTVPLYDECVESPEETKCAAMREAQWAAYEASL